MRRRSFRTIFESGMIRSTSTPGAFPEAGFIFGFGLVSQKRDRPLMVGVVSKCSLVVLKKTIHRIAAAIVRIFMYIVINLLFFKYAGGDSDLCQHETDSG